MFSVVRDMYELLFLVEPPSDQCEIVPLDRVLVKIPPGFPTSLIAAFVRAMYI